MRVKPCPEAPLASVWRHGNPAFFCAGINSFGQLTGTLSNQHAYRYTAGVVEDLGMPGGAQGSGGMDINNSGVVVGGGEQAWMYVTRPASPRTAATMTRVTAWGPVMRLGMNDSFRAARGRQRVPIALAHAGSRNRKLCGDREAANDTPLSPCVKHCENVPGLCLPLGEGDDWN